MRLAALLLACLAAFAREPFEDHTYVSKVFGETRHYRILLPPDYETSGRRYPVIYYFHGHSDRYTVEKYDDGKDTIPKMAAYVAGHPVIVVCVDGYVAADYQGFYGGTPYDVRETGGRYDFGPYFLELVGYIDSTYRTLADRRHRATSGLSMGGFMSLYLSARYPEWVGSASAFNPGPEFYVGEKGRRVLWRPKDHVAQHAHTQVRLVRASGDYISQYHEETRAAYARAEEVDFEFRQDEYHRHWATSIGETFAFHQRAFENAALDGAPRTWRYASAYRSFEVWGCRVNVTSAGSGLTYLEDASLGGLRITTHRWAVDGPAVAEANIAVTTAPLYAAGARYRTFDLNLATGTTESREVTADADGRLHFTVDGRGHQIGFSGPGIGKAAPLLLPAAAGAPLRVEPGRTVHIPVRIFNPGGEPLSVITAKLTSAYPTVEVLSGKVEARAPTAGAVADLSGKFALRFTAGAGEFALTRLDLELAYGGERTRSKIDVLVTPDGLTAPLAMEILDGRTVTLPVFRQKGNQGGGGPVARTVTEGRGNGNGVLEPGEEATIWVKLAQGLDPFDKGNWYRARVYSDSPWITEVDRLEEQKQLEWTSAKELTSVIRMARDTPRAAAIPLVLDHESWSYTFTPDVRYGREPLYQAFQLHKHHLSRVSVKAAR
ncbi:MAG TPA: alpha/beta hydrolase [Bryobacteraceae bacterium]|nr:alpha/beta hydrolase [Bryobacteraceae bacterium]